MNDTIIIKKENGNTIHCYGQIEWDSNFSFVHQNEKLDGIVADIDGSKYNTWRKVCNYLKDNYEFYDHLEQIETC